MSLINQVLKDLDSREPMAQSPSSLDQSVQIEVVEEMSSSASVDWFRLVLWTVTGFMILVVCLYMLWESNFSDKQTVSAQTATLKPPVLVEKITAPVEKKVKLVTEHKRIKNPVLLETKKKQSAQSAIKAVPEQAVTYLPLIDEPAVKHSVEKPSESSIMVKPHQTPLKSIKLLIADGRLSEAEIALNKVIRAKPRNTVFRELLVGLLLRSSRFSEAKKHIEKALAVSPYRENMVLLYAQQLLKDDQRSAAIKVLQEQVKANQAGEKTLAMLAPLYQQSLAFEESVAVYRRLLQQTPDVASYWVGMGVSLEAVSDFSQAMFAYRRAISMRDLSYDLRQYALQRVGQLSVLIDKP